MVLVLDLAQEGVVVGDVEALARRNDDGSEVQSSVVPLSDKTVIVVVVDGS